MSYIKNWRMSDNKNRLMFDFASAIRQKFLSENVENLKLPFGWTNDWLQVEKQSRPEVALRAIEISPFKSTFAVFDFLVGRENKAVME